MSDFELKYKGYKVPDEVESRGVSTKADWFAAGVDAVLAVYSFGVSAPSGYRFARDVDGWVFTEVESVVYYVTPSNPGTREEMDGEWDNLDDVIHNFGYDVEEIPESKVPEGVKETLIHG